MLSTLARKPHMKNQAKLETGLIRWVRPSQVETDDEFRDLSSLPTKDAKATMVKSLLQDGCAETLVVWNWRKRLILLIGYQLFPTLRHHLLPFRVLVKHFRHRGDARQFIIDYFVTYKMITPLALSYYRGSRCRADQLSRGGDRRSADFKKLGKSKSVDALAEVHELPRKVLVHERDYAKALDTLATVADHLVKKGGDRIKPLVFGHNTHGTKDRVIALSKRGEEEQRRKLKELLFSGKLPPCDPDGKGKEMMTLPRRPMSLLAEKLLGKLELEEAVELFKEFGSRLQKRLTALRRDLPEIQPDGKTDRKDENGA